MKANDVLQEACFAFSVLLIAIGVAAFFVDSVGPLPTNLRHGVLLNIAPGVVGIVAWRLRLSSLFLVVMGWALVLIAAAGLLWGESWLYPFFNMSALSSKAELAAGIALVGLSYLIPEVVPASRLPEPEELNEVDFDGRSTTMSSTTISRIF